MGDKTERLIAIQEIISNNKISSQDELHRLLEKRGLNYTQATLSRDLKFLKVNKVSDPEKGYIYVLPEQVQPRDEPVNQYAAQGFISIEFSNKLAVIKTKPAYAPSLASIIDKAGCYEIIGTIAGDDNILIIPRENIGPNDLINRLKLILPELNDRLSSKH